MMRILCATLACLTLVPTTAVTAAQDSLEVSVTSGSAAVADWIVEQRLDLAAVARLLGRETPIKTADVRVLEVGAPGGEPVAVPFQVDHEKDTGEFVVTWRMPGETPPGRTRRFLIALDAVDGGDAAPVIDAPLAVTAADDQITIVNGAIRLEHARDAGGMIRRVTVGETAGDLSWGDYLSTANPGRQHRLNHHAAERMRVVAAGPLRVVVEARTPLLHDDKTHASDPQVHYRFTTYADQPVTHLSAAFTQDFSKLWTITMCTIMDVKKASLSGAKAGDGWAAAYNDTLLIGVADGPKPAASTSTVLIGAKERPHWRSLRFPWDAVVFWGRGGADLESLESWSAILDSRPTTTVHFALLALRIARAAERLAARKEEVAGLTGTRWTAAHVAVTAGRTYLRRAQDAAAEGRLGRAVADLEDAEAALAAEANGVRSSDGVVSGTVAGHPFIGNDKVVYVWCRREDGAGLLSIYDRRMKREFLATRSRRVQLWEIGVKKGTGGSSYLNTGAPCEVSHRPHGLEFVWRWPGAIEARMRATLNPDETIVRMRLDAVAQREDEGLRNVTFPIVPGIEPITPGGKGDRILRTYYGHPHESPLVSGDRVYTAYPSGMQFTAMLAEGRGLYFGEEDPDANRKDLIFLPEKDSGTLEFTIKKAVLGRCGPELVKEYASPGDVVLGPFQGDWYDAARLYRKWAVTAPWCAKGTIDKRADYPKWLAESPFWSIGYPYSRYAVQTEIDEAEAFGVPGVSHAYNWWFQPHQDDGYPDYFPPRLGSEGFKKAVRDMQRGNMRVVPYLNGLLWDKGNESYRRYDIQSQSLRGAGGGELGMTWAGNRFAMICPYSQLWRDKLTEVSVELVDRYGVDGIYFDFLTVLGASDWVGNCHRSDHGHPLCGGNVWTTGVRGLYSQVRRAIKKINPDTMLTGEEWSEYVIDLLDMQLARDHELPLFEAVYHGYTLFNVGRLGMGHPRGVGHIWLYGNQSGWQTFEPALVKALKDPTHEHAWFAKYYRKLLQCHYHFGRPYLAYGEMLRPPRFEGDPSAEIVLGSAWKAPDGSVGIFLLSHEREKTHEWSWSVDLLEGTGWDEKTLLTLSKWTQESGLEHVADVTGGKLIRKATLEPLGLVALKLEKK